MLVMERYFEKVARLRDELGMSREDLARASGLTASYIYRIEKGVVDTPSYQTFRVLAKALGVSVAALAEDAEVVPHAGVETIGNIIEHNVPPRDRVFVTRQVEKFLRLSLEQMQAVNAIAEQVITLSGTLPPEPEKEADNGDVDDQADDDESQLGDGVASSR